MEYVAAALAAVLTWVAAVWPWGLPGVQIFKVKLEDVRSGNVTTCELKNVDPKKFKTLKGWNQDVLVVRIHNQCSTAETVTVTNNATASYATCVSEPQAGGMVFNLTPGKKAHVLCSVRYNPANGQKDAFRFHLAKIRATEIASEDDPLS